MTINKRTFQSDSESWNSIIDNLIASIVMNFYIFLAYFVFVIITGALYIYAFIILFTFPYLEVLEGLLYVKSYCIHESVENVSQSVPKMICQSVDDGTRVVFQVVPGQDQGLPEPTMIINDPPTLTYLNPHSGLGEFPISEPIVFEPIGVAQVVPESLAQVIPENPAQVVPESGNN